MLRITLDGIDEKTVVDTENNTIEIFDDVGTRKHVYHINSIQTAALCGLINPFMQIVGGVEGWSNDSDITNHLFKD